MRVRESGGRACLAHEPFARFGCAREVRREHLDGDVAVQLHVAGEVDDSHSTAAKLALEGVLAGEGRLKLEEFAGGLRHWRWYEGSRADVSCHLLTRHDRGHSSSYEAKIAAIRLTLLPAAVQPRQARFEAR